MTALVAKVSYWTGHAQKINQYIRGYRASHRDNSINERPCSLLKTLDIPISRWEWINVDFITTLPVTVDDRSEIAGDDTIVTDIDSLTTWVCWVVAWVDILTA